MRDLTDRDDAVKKQHDHAVGALNALQRALSVSVEDYPSLKEKGALKRHFDSIHKIMGMKISNDNLREEIDDYFESLIKNSSDSAKKEIIDLPELDK